MIDDDPVLKRLIAWAVARPDVRAVWLTSTRARPGAAVDDLSDYDVVVAVDGKPVQSMIDLAAKVRTRQPGDTVELTVSNGGDQRVVKVTLERAPSN